MDWRTTLLTLSAATCGVAAAIVSYWAVGNGVSWYHNRFVVVDYSAAEADAVLLWIQIPTALLLWTVAVLLARQARRR